MSLGSYIYLFLLVSGMTSVMAVNRACEIYNDTDCDSCLKNSSCFWCITGRACLTAPPGMILPPPSLCPLNNARVGLCAINYQSLIITVAMLAAAIIIAFFICLAWYCRCENCGTAIRERNLKWQASRRDTVIEQRTAETMAKLREIQQKHGLRKGSAYTTFENI